MKSLVRAKGLTCPNKLVPVSISPIFTCLCRQVPDLPAQKERQAIYSPKTDKLIKTTVRYHFTPAKVARIKEPVFLIRATLAGVRYHFTPAKVARIKKTGSLRKMQLPLQWSSMPPSPAPDSLLFALAEEQGSQEAAPHHGL